MRLLVVNNHSMHITQLVSQLESVRTIDFYDLDKISREELRRYDAIILSGGNSLSVAGHEKEYAAELDLIRTCGRPILGICLGFELICHAFGEKLQRGEPTRGLVDIQVLDSDPLFDSLPPQIAVFEAHRWVVASTTFLTALARSPIGIEAARHPTLPIYGVQFHPEVETDRIHARRVLANFRDIALAAIPTLNAPGVATEPRKDR